MHVNAKFYHPTFNRWKHPPRSAMRRRWVKSVSFHSVLPPRRHILDVEASPVPDVSPKHDLDVPRRLSQSREATPPTIPLVLSDPSTGSIERATPSDVAAETRPDDVMRRVG